MGSARRGLGCLGSLSRAIFISLLILSKFCNPNCVAFWFGHLPTPSLPPPLLDFDAMGPNFSSRVIIGNR